MKEKDTSQKGNKETGVEQKSPGTCHLYEACVCREGTARPGNADKILACDVSGANGRRKPKTTLHSFHTEFF